jgi:YidC/Oxa1 family membrane protein insertase
MDDTKNLVITCALCAMIAYFFWTPGQQATNQQNIVASDIKTEQTNSQKIFDNIEDALKEERQEIIRIKSSSLEGSINLNLGSIDDLSLTKIIKDEKPPVRFLYPERYKETSAIYFAKFKNMPEEKWSSDDKELSEKTPISMSRNSDKIEESQKISIDENGMLTIEHKIKNISDSTLSLEPYNIWTQKNKTISTDSTSVHKGYVAMSDSLKEFDYSAIKKSQNTNQVNWSGFTEKYWIGSFCWTELVQDTVSYKESDNSYNIESIHNKVSIESGKEHLITYRLFVGPKQINILDHYEKIYNIKSFDKAIDFGVFYFLTKPLIYLLSFLFKFLGSFGGAILVLTVLVKTAFFPLVRKSSISMEKMKKLQPDIDAIKSKFSSDKVRMNQEIMTLYQKHKINPVSGCFPMLLQIPIFFALYKVFMIAIEMRKAPFIGWISDLSEPDPTHILNGFGLLPWAAPNFFHIGLWPIIMALSMLLQQSSTPMMDPQQQKVMKFMPFVLVFLFAEFPAGLVIYWTWNNILSYCQTWVVKRA